MLKSSVLYVLNYVPAILWAVVIFMLSDQSVLPGFELSGLDFIFKKLAHITVYAVLYVLLFAAVQKNHPKARSAQLILPFLIAFLFAISDEWHQSYVPGRTSTFRDIGYDSLGMYIAFLRTYRYL